VTRNPSYEFKHSGGTYILIFAFVFEGLHAVLGIRVGRHFSAASFD
jgi:hypothetical protein